MTGEEVRKNLGKRVVYNGREYLFSAYIMRYLEKKCRTVPQCELKDLNARSTIVIAHPKDIEALA